MSGNPIRVAARRLPGRWHKGSLRRGANRCAVGHLMDAMEEIGYKGDQVEADPRYKRALALMNEAALDKFPERCEARPGKYSVAAVNDDDLTSQADIMAVLDLAAVRWDVEHGS